MIKSIRGFVKKSTNSKACLNRVLIVFIDHDPKPAGVGPAVDHPNFEFKLTREARGDGHNRAVVGVEVAVDQVAVAVAQYQVQIATIPVADGHDLVAVAALQVEGVFLVVAVVQIVVLDLVAAGVAVAEDGLDVPKLAAYLIALGQGG
jgi:hypothetical protein